MDATHGDGLFAAGDVDREDRIRKGFRRAFPGLGTQTCTAPDVEVIVDAG
jgi:hypothetical protein